MSSDEEKIVIIGAGASGLAAAVAQARMGRKVTVLEHKDKAGIKLSITGNGKCNFTNAHMDASCFHETLDSPVDDFLKRFGAKEAVDFIRSLRLEVEERSGYFYPASHKALDVVNALLEECQRLGADICYEVDDIQLEVLKDTYDKVILACGSRAHKETGSNGTGYKFLEKLGIPYTRVLPALCALYCEDDGFFRNNNGKRAIGTVCIGDHKATGEIQVTEYGLSGIPVFNISRYVSIMLDQGMDVQVTVDFEPDEEDIPEIIKNRANTNQYKAIVGGKTKTFTVRKIASFDRSQVCTGGVSLNDLTEDFEVKKAPGIYVIGEMCDVDGICGGYNLHWAWLSGNLCAK